MYKICHVTNVHKPEDGRIFRRACVSSAKAGYDTYLVEMGNSYDKKGVHIIGIGYPEKPGRLYRMTRFAKKAYRAALQVDADLYHLHDPELLRFASKFKRKGKKVVFDSHENYFDMILRKSYLPLYKLIGKRIYSYIEKMYTIIDGVTYPADDEYYQKIQRLCKTTCITGNYPWKSELYDKYITHIEKENRTACYIGSITRAHGVTEIIRACYLAGFKLYLAGPFYTDDYKKSLFELPEFTCVEYLGVIGREEVLAVLQKVEVGLCVLHNEGQFYTSRNLSTKVYECMAMGLPVILNNSTYNIELIEKYNFGICVNPSNLDEITNALLGLANDKAFAKNLGKNGRQLLAESFCWDKEQINLLRMYDSILNSELE